MSHATTVLDLKLINTVKRFLENYNEDSSSTSSVLDKMVHEMPWKNLSQKIRWLGLQYNYAKIKSFTSNNSELEDVLQNHPKTRMYLDGSLNFLDKYVKEIPDSKIPDIIHEQYKWLKPFINKEQHHFLSPMTSTSRDTPLPVYSTVTGSKPNLSKDTLVTQEMVQSLLEKRIDDDNIDTIDMKYILEVVESTVKQCLINLKESKQITKTITLTDIIRHQLSKPGTNVAKIDDVLLDSFNITGDDKLTINIPINNSDEINPSAKPTPCLKIKEEENVLEDNVDNLNILEIKSEEDTASQIDLKTFFDNVAEFVSEKLTVEKQLVLRCQIVHMITNMLQEDQE